MNANLSTKTPVVRDVDCALAALIAQNPVFGRIKGANVMNFRDNGATICLAPQLVAPKDWDGVKEWVLRIPATLENPDAPLLLEKSKYMDNVIVVYALVWLREKPHIVFEYANIADPPIIRPVNTSSWNSKDWREAAKVNNQLRHFFVNGRDSRGLHSPKREDVKTTIRASEVAQEQGNDQEEVAEEIGYSTRHIRRLKKKYPGLKNSL